jgi:hypothetical protein
MGPIVKMYRARWEAWKISAIAAGMSESEVDTLEISLDEQNAKQMATLRARKCFCGAPLQEKDGYGHVNVSCSTYGAEHFLIGIDRAFLDEIRS